MPIHVAITRRVKPGCEAQFQTALREFFQTSFEHGGVLGATMLVPPPGSGSREFGILRTFTDEKDRDAFYASPVFKAWEKKCGAWVESNSWTYRPLHGLEAWFRSSKNPPPRWKMALVTLLGVYPVSLLIRFTLGPFLNELPVSANMLLVSSLIVMCLTWFVMPLLTKIFQNWLHPAEKENL